MLSSPIRKILKARSYAEEPDRVTITDFHARFHGNNGDHNLSYSVDGWTCTCNFSRTWNYCSHSMALEKLLGPMVKEVGQET